MKNTDPTRALSEAGTAELIREMQHPPADTPERRATLQRAKAALPLVQNVLRNFA